jgi:hypothetical protein
MKHILLAVFLVALLCQSGCWRRTVSDRLDDLDGRVSAMESNFIRLHDHAEKLAIRVDSLEKSNVPKTP